MATRGYEHFTQADADRRALKQSAPAPKSKYKNIKTTIDGETFDSRAESDYWLGLRARQHAGEIYNLKRQTRWPLHCPVQNVQGVSVQVCEYVSDFEWDEAGEHVVCDLKGVRTAIYKLKRKWLILEHGISIKEV